jgi:hypothetical protein
MLRHGRGNGEVTRPATDLWSSLENVPPALVAALALLTGVLLIIGSVLSHTNKAVFSQIGKTLGYFYEVNWSVNYVVAIPVALYFCASAMNAIRHVIGELSKSKMIVGSDGEPRASRPSTHFSAKPPPAFASAQSSAAFDQRPQRCSR